MGIFKNGWREVLDDQAVIKEFKRLYKKGEIATDRLLALLHEGKISLQEFIKITKT